MSHKFSVKIKMVKLANLPWATFTHFKIESLAI